MVFIHIHNKISHSVSVSGSISLWHQSQSLIYNNKTFRRPLLQSTGSSSPLFSATCFICSPPALCASLPLFLAYFRGKRTISGRAFELNSFLGFLSFSHDKRGITMATTFERIRGTRQSVLMLLEQAPSLCHTPGMKTYT